jgi:acyl-homoserine lactone synthase
MIFIVNHENRVHFEQELEEMHRQRKKIFIERLGWTLAVSGDLEIDEYDGEETLYLLSLQSAGGPSSLPHGFYPPLAHA